MKSRFGHFSFLIFFVSHFSFAEVPPNSYSWENCVVYSDGNALYAVNRADSQPLWSETGQFYRESFDFDDWAFAPETKRKNRARPTQMFAEHLVREGRLYVLLNRSAFGPQRGNVLAAFDLTQEGKLLWRISLEEEKYSRNIRFDLIETLIDDQLTVLLTDRSVLRIPTESQKILPLPDLKIVSLFRLKIRQHLVELGIWQSKQNPSRRARTNRTSNRRRTFLPLSFGRLRRMNRSWSTSSTPC
ncbi:MAG: hypothetical protein FWC43_03295 [Planctomycetaceae bacterium]|nr:hypothetical protein [Planctomycetaceae bacterium]